MPLPQLHLPNCTGLDLSGSRHKTNSLSAIVASRIVPRTLDVIGRLWLLAALSCGPLEPSQTPVPRSLAQQQAALVSCPVNLCRYRNCQRAATRYPGIRSVMRLGELRERSWVVARREEQALLVHLGPGGKLIETKMPALNVAFAIESPQRIRFFATQPAPQWWTVDVSEPDKPRVNMPTPMPELQAATHWAAFASDGKRALVSSYRPTPRNAHAGRTTLFEVASGKRLGETAPLTTWAAACSAKGCFAYATPNGSKKRQLLRVHPGGSNVLHDFGESRCQAAVTWRDGNVWLLAKAMPQQLSIWAVNLTTGEVKNAAYEIAGRACPDARHVVFAENHGLLLDIHSPQPRFIPIDGALNRRRPEPVERPKHQALHLAPFVEGALAVDYTSTVFEEDTPRHESGYYFVNAAVEGRLATLTKHGDEWRWSNVQLIPAMFASGKSSKPYAALIMTRPDHARLWLTGADNFTMLIRKPCEWR